MRANGRSINPSGCLYEHYEYTKKVLSKNGILKQSRLTAQAGLVETDGKFFSSLKIEDCVSLFKFHFLIYLQNLKERKQSG